MTYPNPIELNQANLTAIGARLGIPNYPRGQVSNWIMHFGVGGFHRSHQAMYLDALRNLEPAVDWGICGVGVLPGDARMRDAMAAQDCLYTLVTKHPDGQIDGQVIGSIEQYLFAPDDPERVLEKLSDPATKLVSLTITEAGYPIDDSTGEFDPSDPAIAADLVRRPSAAVNLTSDEPPRTVFGLIVEGLARRRRAGIAPFTVLCCDNIQFNGRVCRDAVVGFATAVDPDLGSYVASEVRFPNAMVDRITPATTDELRAEVVDRFGVVDQVPVVSESFSQWVVEDDFTLGRPDLDRVGVQLVADVEPYELIKLRLLNATHQALAYAGFLAGHEYVHDAVADPIVRDYVLDGYMRGEAIDTLKEVPGIDIDAYCEQLMERFGSAEVRDTVARLAVDGSDRISKFVLPVISDRSSKGLPSPVCALLIATWCRFSEGSDDDGRPAPISDKRQAALTQAAHADRANPGAFLDQPLFGALASNDAFRSEYVAAKELLLSRGVHGAMQSVTERAN